MVRFGTLNPDGTETNVREISQQTIMKCPYVILVPDHYRADGSCKCSNAKERKMMIKEWGYTKKDFKNIPLVD